MAKCIEEPAEELDVLLDKMIADERDVETMLADYELTEDEALSLADKFIGDFRSAADEAGIDLSRKKPLIWFDILEKFKAGLIPRGMLITMIADCSLLFGNGDNEYKISSYIHTVEEKYRITEWLENYETKTAEFNEIREKTAKIKSKDYPCETYDSLCVFNMLCREGYVDDCENKKILSNNLFNIGMAINDKDFLKPIAPLIYFWAFVSYRQKLLKEDGFTTKLSMFLRRKEYKIEEDNHKNFKQHTEYCELYIDLKNCLLDADHALCDAGFLACSNLADWWYENIEPTDDLPLTPRAFVDECCALLFSDPAEDIGFFKDNGVSHEDILRLKRKNVLLRQKAQKAARTVSFDDLPCFVSDYNLFLDKLFEQEQLFDGIKSKQLTLMRSLLVDALIERFDELFEDELCAALFPAL